MSSLLNKLRPQTFCPGCGHEQALIALDKAFALLGWKGHEIVIVSDIGCSGLFDTFFNTHAFHGLHGRAIPYAIGLKMVRPKLHVIVTMGDGGFGIGAAHFLSACRRNIDITLLVLNNFNFGMTGGQYSPTTPSELNTGSGFLNRLEKPVDIGRVAQSAGAGYVDRLSVYQPDLPRALAAAMRFDGFSVVDLRGICSGRLAHRNRLTPAIIEASIQALPSASGEIPENCRPEYGGAYRKIAAEQPPASPPLTVKKRFAPIIEGRAEVLIMGGAGQRVVTAGEILCLAGMTAGLQVTCKTDYPVTVLRGHSLSEVILSSRKIGFTGIEHPSLVIALSPEGVERRPAVLKTLRESDWVILAAGVEFPDSPAEKRIIDFRALGIKSADWALAALAVMAAHRRCITEGMLMAALSIRFDGEALIAAQGIVKKMINNIGILC